MNRFIFSDVNGKVDLSSTFGDAALLDKINSLMQQERRSILPSITKLLTLFETFDQEAEVLETFA